MKRLILGGISTFILFGSLVLNIALSAPPPTPTPALFTPSQTPGTAQLTATAIIRAATETAAAQIPDHKIFAEAWLREQNIEARDVKIRAILTHPIESVFLFVFTFEYDNLMCVGVTTTSSEISGNAACDVDENELLWNYWFYNTELTVIYGHVKAETWGDPAGVTIEFPDSSTISQTFVDGSFLVVNRGILIPNQVTYLNSAGIPMYAWTYPDQDIFSLNSPDAPNPNLLTATAIYQNQTATREAIPPAALTSTALLQSASQTATAQGTGIAPAQMTATSIIAGATATAAAQQSED